MSVEKFIVTKEDSGYTTLPNQVLQNLLNLEALGLWCYFQSMPPKWEFNKKNIREFFNIGIHKLENLCAILKNHNLIEIKQDRNARGHYDLWHLHVKNGSEFTPFSKNCRTEKTSRKHRAPENRAPDNRATVNSTYKRKKVEKKIGEEKKQKSFYEKANSKKHDWAAMKNEKAAIEKHEAIKRTPMPDNLKEFMKTIRKPK